MKYLKLTGILVTLLFLLTGCMYSSAVEELYELPKLPDEYTALRSELDAITAEGAENSPPISGTNVQSVQLTDLDGDGIEEAVAFFKKPADEKPLKIYIFRATGDTYTKQTVIESSGTAIYSVRYVDLNGDGLKEILVGWRVSAEIQALGVYSIKEEEPVPLMFSLYSRYEVLDFDGDDMFELVLLRSNTDGIPVADFYDWENELLVSRSTTRLSMTMAELRTMEVGVLRGGETAVFISGVAEDTRAITDILTYRKNGMANVVQQADTGVTGAIFSYVGLEPLDINGDGITEIPAPTPIRSVAAELQWQIDWRSYDAKGVGETVLSTYHNLSESWYLVLPDNWIGEIGVTQSSSGNERATTFYLPLNSEEQKELLTIYTLSGNNKAQLAAKDGRIVLKQQISNIYAAKLPEERHGSYSMTEEELTLSFSIISKEWSSGEN